MVIKIGDDHFADFLFLNDKWIKADIEELYKFAMWTSQKARLLLKKVL